MALYRLDYLCSKCGHTWELEDFCSRPSFCDRCGEENEPVDSNFVSDEDATQEPVSAKAHANIRKVTMTTYVHVDDAVDVEAQLRGWWNETDVGLFELTIAIEPADDLTDAEAERAMDLFDPFGSWVLPEDVQ